MLGWDTGFHALIALGVAFLAGALNAVAGGGTNLSFPVLLWLGLPAVAANATNTVALWPGGISAVWGYRERLRGTSRRWWLLGLPALAGGALGAWLLVHTPSRFFELLAPWLVIGSTVMIALDPVIGAWARRRARETSPGWLVGAVLSQFLIALYGGYFGAGIGILILSTLSLLGIDDIQRANGLKNAYSLALKGVAVAYFIAVGEVVWYAALTMGAGATVGGYVAARLGQRVSGRAMRWTVVAVGLAMGAILVLRGLGRT